MIITKVQSGFNSSMILSEVKVFGVKEQPKYVTINDQSYNNFTFDDYNMVTRFDFSPKTSQARFRLTFSFYFTRCSKFNTFTLI